MTLNEIDQITREYALQRKMLADRVQDLEDEILQIKKRHINSIKKSVETTKALQHKLSSAIETSPELFVKPRSIVLYGIKVGFQKGKGELKIDDADRVIKLIKKYFPDQADILIKVDESPVKAAISKLPGSDLKKLGLEIIETGDQVVIKPTDGEVDKLVEALLKEEIKEVKEAA